MKRCPQCNRVESDETLKFCRADGTTLIADSSSFNSEAGTAQLGSGSVATEINTNIIPQRTDAEARRSTGPTVALPQTATSETRELNKRGKRTAFLAPIAAIVVVAI